MQADQAGAELTELAGRNNALQLEVVQLKMELQHQQELARDRIAFLENSEKRQQTEFANLANRLLEEKGRQLSEQHREKLSQLVTPFKEQLKEFRERIDRVHEEELKQGATLLTQIRQMQETSNKVSAEANNLAAAIKGDKKKQGNWGELIIERLFESSGLERGREYEAQVSLETENGGRLQPDFVVYLPNDRAVIVDSKVSLLAYEQFCNAATEEERQAALAAHHQAVKNHIQGLRSKNYQDLLKNNTLDFVIMCIPIEPAYQLALYPDHTMLYEQSHLNVVLTGPSTLLITLKLINQIWRREKENRNAAQMAVESGKMFDTFMAMLDNLAELDRALGAARGCYDQVLKRINSGNNNILRQMERIRSLGAKTSRQLSVKAGTLLENRDESLS